MKHSFYVLFWIISDDKLHWLRDLDGNLYTELKKKKLRGLYCTGNGPFVGCRKPGLAVNHLASKAKLRR
jgi:hypothetical protein